MKIADFFVQITAKGDLKELQAVVEYQKTLQKQAQVSIERAKVKVAQLKKETIEIQKQSKQIKEEPKTLREVLIAHGKIFNQQKKLHLLMGKGVLQAMGLSSAVLGIAASAVTAAIAIDRMVTKLAQANQLYSNFQRQTGMPMGSAIGMAGAMANLDVTMTPQEIMQNMQNLQSNLIGVQFGMGNIAPYQMAGINPFGINSANMMDVIRKQLKGFAPAYRTFLLQQIGLDPRLGALIDLSDTEYLKYKKEALELYLSPADRKVIQQLAPEWNKVNLKFAKAWDTTTMLLMQDFTGLATEIGHLVDIFLRVQDILHSIFKPLLDIITLIIKPIYYLLDDIVVWLLGGKSIIGDMLTLKFPTAEEWGKIFKEAFGFALMQDSNDAFEKKSVLTAPYHFGKWIGSGLANLLMPRNLTGTTNNAKIMNNDIKISVGNSTDGYEMANRIDNVFNRLIAQW